MNRYMRKSLLLFSRFLAITAIVLFIIIVLSMSTYAKEYPTIKPYVNDFVGVLSPSDISILNQLATQIEKNTSVEIAIVIVNSTNGEDRVLYANNIGEQNGVGKKEKDNGVIILWSMSNERGGAIATGRGIESILNDAKVARIGRDSKDEFEAKNYSGGFLIILNKINYELGYNVDGTKVPNDAPSSFVIFIIVVIVALIFVMIILFDESSGGYSSGSVISVGGVSGSSGGVSFGGGSFGGGGGRF